MTNEAPATVRRDSPVQPGDVLAGKYRVETVLGAGGMGVVVSARHVQLGELVALKFLRTEELGRPDSVARFLREAQAAIRIKSEHVARVTDMGTLEGGAPYIVMEYLSGTDLSGLVHEDGPLPIARAIEYVLQACEAIAEAHALGIVHRDLKPSNLFLTTRFDGSPLVKVLDFGIAKSLAMEEGAPSLTASQSMLGSPTYMSPEQVRSARRVDARSDIWSIGIILFELLSGRGPFQAESVHGMLAAIMSDTPDGLRGIRPEVSPELEQIVMRCLEKEADRRFQNVGDLARELGPFAPRAQSSVERILNITGPGGAAAPVVAERSKSLQSGIATQKELISSAPTIMAPEVVSVRKAPLPSANVVTAPGWAEASRPGRRSAAPAIAIAAVLVLGIGYFAVRTMTSSPPPPTTADSAPPSTTAASPSAAASSAVIVAPVVGSADPVPVAASASAHSVASSVPGVPRGALPGRPPPVKPKDPTRVILPDSRD